METLVKKLSVTVVGPSVTGPPVLQANIVKSRVTVLPLVTALDKVLVSVTLGGPIRVVGAGSGTHWRQKRAPTEVP